MKIESMHTISGVFVSATLSVAAFTAAPAVKAQTSERMPQIEIAGVYGAQTHVINLNDQTYGVLKEGVSERAPFPMLADRDMLFKLNLIEVSQTPVNNFEATVTLDLNGQTTTIALDPPAVTGLPGSFDTNPATVVHTFDDSFTTTIPKDWMKPGLKWEVGWCHSPGEARHCVVQPQKTMFVRPPIKMTINVFPFEYFGWNWRSVGVDIDSLLEEMAQKLPVSELIVRKPENDYYQVDKLLIPGQGGAAAQPWNSKPEVIGNPPGIISSRKDQDGKLLWFTQNNDATAWNQALYEAAGSDYNRYTASYMWLGMQFPGAKGVGATNSMTTSVFSRVGGYGLAWHESLHMYGLNHWGEGRGPVGNGHYPYIFEYLGRTSQTQKTGHIGATWAFDAREQLFLPPTVTKGDGSQHWRAVPEKKGNDGAHWELGMKLGPLSDWSAVQIMQRYGGRPAWFDADADSYWVQESGWHKYSWETNRFEIAQVSKKDEGVKVPAWNKNAIEVYTVVMQASTATEFYNKEGGEKIRDIEPVAMVYPPIGPYVSNFQVRVDPRNETSRQWGLSKGMCDEVTSYCDFSIRVKKNGKWFVNVLDRKVDWDPEVQAWGRGNFSPKSFVTVAISLPAQYGEIEEAHFLHTPNVLQNAWVPNPKVLATWKK